MNRPQLISVSLLAVLASCSTGHRHKHKHNADVVRVRPVETTGIDLPQAEYDSIRNAEVIKQYYTGDYVDPNNPSVRHNAHNVQRVEQAASWNLRPSAPVVAGGPSYVASSAEAQKNAISAQLSGALDRQKGYTDALAQQNEKLQEIIQQLKEAKEQETQANTAKDAELKLTVETLKTLKQEIQKQPAWPSPRPFPVFAPPKTPTLFDGLNGNEEQVPSNTRLSPKVQDLLDVVDDHVTALENEKVPERAEDTIELDDVYAPLANVAQGKK